MLKIHVGEGALTQWQSQTADHDLNAGDGDKGRFDVAGTQPVVSTERQAKGENILENQKAGEALHGDLAVGVDDVECRGHGAEDHAHDLHGEEEIGPEPAVGPDVAAGNAEPVKTGAAKDELRNDEDEPELGLVDAVIALRHPFHWDVRQHACN